MAREVLTKLSNDDLVQVCGGQIYAATEGNVTRWYVPTPPGSKTRYSGYFTTEIGALNYARTNGLWMDTTTCESYHQASVAASAKGIFYEIQEKVPSQMNPSKWNGQLTEFFWHNKVSPFSY